MFIGEGVLKECGDNEMYFLQECFLIREGCLKNGERQLLEIQ